MSPTNDKYLAVLWVFMPGHLDVVSRAVRDIDSFDEAHTVLSKRVREASKKPLTRRSGFVSDVLFFPVPKQLFSGTIAGVDSGFVDKPLFGFSLLLVRAVGVAFELKDSKLQKAHYVPRAFSFPLPRLNTESVDALELGVSNGLSRLVDELDTALALVEMHRPDVLFLDGSLLPQYTGPVPKSSSLYPVFSRVLGRVQSLFALCQKEGVELVGCVEDSRATRFSALAIDALSLPMDGARPVFDSVLLDYALSHRERTAAFLYADPPEQHALLSQLEKKWQSAVFAMYLRPSSHDRPLRVEFLSSPAEAASKAEVLAPIVQAVSGSHREYAYPTVLIEADLRARLKPQEIDTVYNKILDRLGRHRTRALRRNARPF